MTRPVAPHEEPQRQGDMSPGAGEEAAGANTRGILATLFVLLLVVLGASAIVKLNRSRPGHDGRKTMQSARAPHSEIRIAAPRSVVNIVSAPTIGRSHVQMPTARPLHSAGLGRAETGPTPGSTAWRSDGRRHGCRIRQDRRR